MADATLDAVSRCLALVKTADSDNEKLASLLIVAELLKSRDLDGATRRKIFDAVGFDFINRLLSTKTNDDASVGSEKVGPFHQVAAAILSSYCSDEELVNHPQVTSKIPHFNHFISSNISSNGLINDSLYCLQSLSSSEKGRQYLWYHSSLVSLIQCYITHNQSFGDMSKSLVMHLVVNITDYNVTAVNSSLLQCFHLISEQFKILQNQMKFKLCQLLTDILNICGENITETDWLHDIGIGYRDILQSKLDANYRAIVYTSLSTLCMLYGCQWLNAIPVGELQSLLMLVAHLMNVEICMSLDTTCHIDSATTGNSTLIVSCFSILENIIIQMTKSSQELTDERTLINEPSVLNEEQLLQLHTVVLEALICTVKYIHQLSTELTDTTNQLLLPAVRVIGSWLAEDSLSLTTEIKPILPFLLRQCSQDGDGMEYIKFLLPGLSNLIVQDEYCQLLLSNGLMDVLVNYIEYLTIRVVDDIDMRLRLTIPLSIVLTICTTDSIQIKGTQCSLLSLLYKLNKALQGNYDDILLKLHIVVLYLIIVKKNSVNVDEGKDDDTNSVRAAIEMVESFSDCLSSVILMESDGTSAEWESAMELCHLGINGLTDIVKQCSDIKQCLVRDKQLLLKMLQIQNRLSEDNTKLLYYADIITSVCGLLSSLDTQK